ncbi:MAG: DUF2490 domain-containing protein [Kofleriaceae bacterium]|nr:DUF2490 domain-containing protein [Kofleriaceae bacterium]
MSLLALACVAPAYADSQLWLEPGVGVAPVRRVDVDLTGQVRFDQDVTRFSAFLPELTARYRIERWLRVGGGYRLEYERDAYGQLVIRDRLSADARIRVDSARIRVDYRLMVAEQRRPMSNNVFRTVLRNRVDVSYRRLGLWRPFGGVEVFYMLDDLDKLEYDRTRLTAGTTYKAKDFDIDMFVRAEIHADPDEPTYAILGLGYHYQL